MSIMDNTLAVHVAGEVIKVGGICVILLSMRKKDNGNNGYLFFLVLIFATVWILVYIAFIAAR